jgi:hypothetical protein
MLLNGIGVTPDSEKTEYWFNKAKEKDAAI